MTHRPEEIAAEYDEAATEAEEFARVKWGSAESMANRFELALRELPFARARTWLDVGCGTGAFQARALGRHPHLEAVGIDLSERLLEQSRRREGVARAMFVRADVARFAGGPFDLVTAIGVLQKTTVTPAEFFRSAARLLVPGGRVLVSTKHRGWRPFLEGGLRPEESHDWFTEEDLRGAAVGAGLEVLRVAGYLPREDRVVPPAESHDLFLIAERARAE